MRKVTLCWAAARRQAYCMTRTLRPTRRLYHRLWNWERLLARRILNAAAFFKSSDLFSATRRLATQYRFSVSAANARTYNARK